MFHTLIQMMELLTLKMPKKRLSYCCGEHVFLTTLTIDYGVLQMESFTFIAHLIQYSSETLTAHETPSMVKHSNKTK